MLIGALILPQLILSSFSPSLTINLSFTDLPVCFPVNTTSAPSFVVLPSNFFIEISYNSSDDKFEHTFAAFFKICIFLGFSIFRGLIKTYYEYDVKT